VAARACLPRAGSAGGVSSAGSSARLTLQRAPTTRKASARGSVESRVTFKGASRLVSIRDPAAAPWKTESRTRRAGGALSWRPPVMTRERVSEAVRSRLLGGPAEVRDPATVLAWRVANLDPNGAPAVGERFRPPWLPPPPTLSEDPVGTCGRAGPAGHRPGGGPRRTGRGRAAALGPRHTGSTRARSGPRAVGAGPRRRRGLPRPAQNPGRRRPVDCNARRGPDHGGGDGRSDLLAAAAPRPRRQSGGADLRQRPAQGPDPSGDTARRQRRRAASCQRPAPCGGAAPSRPGRAWAAAVSALHRPAHGRTTPAAGDCSGSMLRVRRAQPHP